MAETGLTRNQILSSLSRSAHGKLIEYLVEGKKAAVQEAEFFAHLIAWDRINGQIRDAKVALPVVSLTAPNFPPALAENSMAHLGLLGPRELLRAYRFALEVRPAGWMRKIRGIVELYLRDKENDRRNWNKLAIQHRKTLKEMYAVAHIKPSADADAILFKGERPAGSVFDVVARLKDMSPMEAASELVTRKLPCLIAMGALGQKAKDTDLVLALIGRMSPTELVTNTKMLEKLGVKDNPALRGAFEEALKKAASSKKNVLKTTRAAEAIEDEGLKQKLRGLQDKQLQSMGVEGNWLVLADCSGSMERAIEISRHVSATLAKMVKGRVWLVFFNTAPQTIDATRNGLHRESYAQVGETVVVCNGHDPNMIFTTRMAAAGAGLAGAWRILGIIAPAAAPTCAAAAATGPIGNFLYRVRWKDAITQTISLPSPVSAVMIGTGVGVTVTRPSIAATPALRATHWILERTEDGGAVYYPVNVTLAAPDGTLIATTTFDDTVMDNMLRMRQGYPENQGQPSRYRFCFSNQGRAFVGGGRVHRFTATMVNGDATVVGTGFASDMVGQDFTIDGDVTGVAYRVLTYTSAISLELDSNWVGTSADYAASITSRRDRAAFSEQDKPEYFGPVGYSALANEFIVGDDGEPLTGGAGMGLAGVLWAKSHSLYHHRYDMNPDGVNGDGRLVKIPVNRGCVGPMALKFIDGWVYGIDTEGIWRLSPGSMLPQGISGDIASDWKTNNLGYLTSDNWHVGFDPATATVWFFVTFAGQTYPTTAYLWSVEREKWIGTRYVAQGVTSSVVLPDSNGVRRLCFFGPAITVGQTTSSDFYMSGIGNLDGTAPILAKYRTGRIMVGRPDRKMDSVECWLFTKAKLNCTTIKVRWYAANSASASVDRGLSYVEDGVNSTAGAALTIIDPSYAESGAGVLEAGIFRHRFRIPIASYMNDVILEFYSDEATDMEPWEIMGIKFNVGIDESWDPRG